MTTQRILQWLLGAIAVFAIAACGAQPDAGNTAGTDRDSLLEDVSPGDFALVACGDQVASDRCVLVVAGGKRVLIGAPSGVASALPDEVVSGLDAVLLVGLSGADVEGLDELRNAGWLAGRAGPLSVSGPRGTEALTRGLNAAFQVSDAMAQVESDPPGGFGAALLRGKDVSDAGRAFDTGDLVIDAYGAGPFRQAYGVNYGTVSLLVVPCGLDPAALSIRTAATAILTCTPAEGDIGWPLGEPVVYLFRDG